MQKMIWTFCLVCTASVQAQHVSESEVWTYADRWLRQNPLLARYQKRQIVPLEISGIELLQLGQSHLPFYLVRLNPRGYIVMNNDRRLKPVLCFSTSGDINLEDREDNALYDLLLVQSEKNTRLISSRLSSKSALPEWNLRSGARLMGETFGGGPGEDDSIGPLLGTSWGQANHYNEYCPLAPDASDDCDGRVPVGCVATAFAQVMKYHQWPYRGTGSIAYEDTEGIITGTHAASFSDPYEWWHMQNEYYTWGIEPQEAVNAVSELMYELGVAAKTNYETGLSTANTEELGREIQDHFYYERLTHTESSDVDQLMNSVLNDLAAQRPCIANMPGHSLVIDGHMKQGQDRYFHVNYGFSGQNDGWYMLDNVLQEPITEVVTGISPALTALHLDSESTTNGIELRWVLPETRSEEITRIDVLKRNKVSGTWKDEAEHFSMFEITSTSDYKDWSLSPAGYNGNCFYKTGGGYSNREYHLTSTSPFRPTHETRLTFKTRYILGEDGISVRISNDDGSSFSSVWSVSGSSQEDWREIHIALGAFSEQDVLIRFEYLPGNYYANGGVWIDDIQLVSAQWYDWSVIHEVSELKTYQAEIITSFQDEAENFSTFSVTSTSDYKDWSLSSAGQTGDCFYKPGGGYGNRDYHLTSASFFRPGQDTRLAFKAKYFLSEDAFRILISIDNGSSFLPLWSASNSLRKYWTEIQIPLEAFSGQNILIRFDYLTGNYYQDGGIWIDEIRLIDVTGAEYLRFPMYYTYLSNLPEGRNILAYQVWSGEQIHSRSEAFSIDVVAPLP
ncbi:MAG: C10 family peptidase [Phycisphaerales bacterium]|nr:MAG: C10 family peptidase [Phycisphaerales bacterium]